MAERANEGAQPPDPNETVTREELERLQAQLKGEQRSNARLRKQAAGVIKAEEVAEKLDIVVQNIDGLSKVVAALAGDDETTNTLEKLRASGKTAKEEVAAESAVLTEIQTLEIEHGLSMDEVPKAAAHAEVGNLTRALEELQAEVAVRSASQDSELELERAARAAGRAVDEGESNVSVEGETLTTEAGIRRGYDKAIAEGKTGAELDVYLEATLKLEG